MNPVLQRLIETRRVESLNGELLKNKDGIHEQSGLYLQQLILETGVRETLEVGLGFGTSALFICDALRSIGGGRHIVIDPYQHSDWGGIGLHNLHVAGLDDLVEFYPEPSFVVLSTLAREKRQVDLAFIDGFTTFDYKLVDTFLADKLLRVDRVLVIRTGGTSSGAKLTSYIAANWPWYERLGNVMYEQWEDIVAFRKLGVDSRGWKFHKDF